MTQLKDDLKQSLVKIDQSMMEQNELQAQIQAMDMQKKLEIENAMKHKAEWERNKDNVLCDMQKLKKERQMQQEQIERLQRILFASEKECATLTQVTGRVEEQMKFQI